MYHDCCFLCWGIPTFLQSGSPGHLFTFLWLHCNRSLLLWCVSFAEPGLHRHKQNWSPGHCQLGPDGPDDFCGLDNILCCHLIYCPLLLFRELTKNSLHLQFPDHCGSPFFFAPLLFIYIWTATTLSEDKAFVLFYTIIAPMLNPLNIHWEIWRWRMP